MASTSTDQCTTAGLFVGTFILAYFVWRRLEKQGDNVDKLNGKKLPPSIPVLPFIGSMPFLPDRSVFHKFFLAKALEGRDVMLFYAKGKRMVVLSSYEAIREAFIKQSVETADRPDHYLNQFAFNPSGKGIIDRHYDAKFKKFHQLSLSILKEFGFGQRVMEERITIEVEDLISNFKALKGAPVYPKPLLASSVLSVISSIVLGDRLKDPEVNSRVAQTAEDLTRTTLDLFPVEFLHFLIHLPKFKTALNRVMDSMRMLENLTDQNIDACLSAEGIRYTESFVAKFIEKEGKGFDRLQLKYTCRDLLVAGFETSSTTLLWALLTLANRTEIQVRLQAEIDSVVPRDRLPALDDRGRLPYVEAFILEVMRHDTLVPLSVPRSNLDEVTIGEYVIPKGTMIFTNLYAVHMNPEVWGDPENFRPERFLDATGTNVVNKERVIPFSIGKRSCLGELLARQEIFLFVSGLLQNFHVRPPEGEDHVPTKEFLGFTVSPEPYNVRFLARI